jgi:predicted MFS family arabinose efflux permease
VRPYASLDRPTRIYFATVIALGLSVIPIGWVLHPVKPTDVGDLLYLGIGTQLAGLMPVRWARGVHVVSTPLLVATSLVAPGAGVAIVAWLTGFDRRRPGREVTWTAFLFNNANVALTYGVPSLVLSYFPSAGPFDIPIKTAILTLSIICINYPLTARAFAGVTGISFIQALVENVGLTTIRTMMILGFVGGMLFLVLQSRPEGYVMALALFGVLLAIRANLADSQQQTMERLQTLQLAAETLDARDPYTESHSQRVADLAARLGDALALNGREIEQLRTAGALHDLGKIGVRDDVLNKAEKLNDEEWEVMKRHPTIGADMIAKHSALAGVAPFVRSHHERWNGSGYPGGLCAEDIPLGARILAVADSYDTISTARVYRPSRMTVKEAVEDITQRAGTWYDPVVVNGLRQIHDMPLLPVPETVEAPAFTQRGVLRLLWSRPRFARMLTGTTISSLGDPMTTVAALVSVYSSTHDPALAVAGTYVTKALATILVSGAAGALPDRVRRARLIIWLELARAALLVLTPFLIGASIWSIYPVLFVLAAVNAIVEPARQATLPELVEPREVGPANAGLSAAGMIAEAAGYAIAGLVIWVASNATLAGAAAALPSGAPTTSAGWLFWADGLTFLVAGLLVIGLGDLGGGVKRAGIWSGLGRTWATKAARPHLVVAAAAAFFISMSFPTLITLAYRLTPLDGARTYSLLQVMLAVGIVAGSVFVGRMRNIGSMRTVAQGLAITGVLSLGVAVSPWIWLVAVFLLLASAGNPVYSVGNVTALMEVSDASNRGAILSSRFAITQLALIGGAAVGGLVSQYVGPGVTYGALGVGLLALAIVAGWLLPAGRGGRRSRSDDRDRLQPEAARERVAAAPATE